MYGALINKSCVCEGYSESFKFLMDALDIPSTIVIGKATNSEGKTESHSWNYVQINDIWYAIDCTWDDPILVGGGILTNSFKYRYFLKGSNEFNETHLPEGQFTENGKVFTYPNLNNENY
jgi:transglutaminase/protease-like cytokinesis protein 3